MVEVVVDVRNDERACRMGISALAPQRPAALESTTAFPSLVTV